MSVFLKSAFRRRAPVRSAPGSRAAFKSDPWRFAFFRIAPEKFRPAKSAFERSAPVRSARAPPSFPRKKSSCASRISVNFFPWCLTLFGFLSPMTRPVSNGLDLYGSILLELARRENPLKGCKGVLQRTRNQPHTQCSWVYRPPPVIPGSEARDSAASRGSASNPVLMPALPTSLPRDAKHCWSFATGASAVRWNRGSSRRQSGLGAERIHDCLRHVFAPARIVVHGLNGVNRSPGNAPPACHQREQRERQAFAHRAFALPQEINVRRPAKGHHDDRDAILEQDELSSALDLELQLAVLHPLDTANLGRHGRAFLWELGLREPGLR